MVHTTEFTHHLAGQLTFSTQLLPFLVPHLTLPLLLPSVMLFKASKTNQYLATPTWASAATSHGASSRRTPFVTCPCVLPVHWCTQSHNKRASCYCTHRHYRNLTHHYHNFIRCFHIAMSGRLDYYRNGRFCKPSNRVTDEGNVYRAIRHGVVFRGGEDG